MWSKCIFRTAAARYWMCGSAVVLLIAIFVENRSVMAQNQQFNSTSTGADGALSFTTASPTPIFFDPTKIPNHHAGDTIFNFTTINIAQGVTVRLDSRNLPGPVYWLATGAVTIAGTLDLSGMPGHAYTGNRVDRLFSVPGAGGFAGGPGGGSQVTAEPGAGPGAGSAGNNTNNNGTGGTFSGSQYLIPLIGGSGGGGSFYGVTTFSAGGGAGGGAVLIASSTSITVAGTINASGGGTSPYGAYPGGGSGGAIRLMANSITAPSGASIIANGTQGNGPGSSGFIRFESFQTSLANYTVVSGQYATSTPNAIALPATGPSTAKVLTVNGTAVSGNPFVFPSFTINTSNPVPVVIQAQNVPLGAVPTLYIISETGPDLVKLAPALTGTFQSSTSIVNIPYPPGGSRGLVRVNW